jgi:hypothetical protein
MNWKKYLKFFATLIIIVFLTMLFNYVADYYFSRPTNGLILTVIALFFLATYGALFIYFLFKAFEKLKN